jgi:hypothetical protein
LVFILLPSALHVDARTDEGGEISINPEEGFADHMAKDPRALIGLVNLTAILAPFRR